MKKYIRAIAVAGVLIISVFLIAAYAASTRADYYGFISCTERQELPWMHEALTLELTAFFLFLLLGIGRIFFSSCNQIKIVAFISIVMALNLITLAYKILEYPIILRRNGIFSDVEEGSMRSPLFGLILVHAILAIGWINFILKGHLSAKRHRTVSLVLLLLVIAGVIFYTVTKPVRCFG